MKKVWKEEYIPYEYRHAPVPGGGFVTGFCFHPNKKDILYARTDIGGVYRYDFSERTWVSLMDHVKAIEKWESYPLSIALDPKHPDWIYIAAGDLKSNFICRSKDFGKHFEYYKLSAGVHGNAPGRGTGERLAVDPHNSSILYFGSQTEGLLVSEDYGESWSKLPVKPEGGNTETDLAFVWLDPRSKKEDRCQTIVVSTSGKENSPGENVRGCSLYLSKDAGKTFTPLPGQPSAGDYGNYPGFVGQRATFAGRYLFITMAAIKNARMGWSGYACDNGGEQKGCILRYELTEQGDINEYRLITPELEFMGGTKGSVSEISGFGGICTDVNSPGHLVCTTQCYNHPDAVLYSSDYGEHWFPVLQGLEIGRLDNSEVPYMKPEYNNNGSIIHWLSDIKINPFNSNQAVFNTGTGIFMTENLTDCNTGETVVWKPECKGLEETVHLNVYSPPKGEVQLIDIIGDLGGFAFTDLAKPAENSFEDENHQRYITCLNADFSDYNPELVAVTARGNWIGKTTGGVIWSEDQCKTWRRLPDPLNITQRIDKLIEAIRRPNTNSGWVALSSDVKTLVWCVGERYRLPIDAVVYTEDLGTTWNRSKIYDLNRQLIENSDQTLKVISDRVDPEVFYGFGDDSIMFLSTDRARTFYQVTVPDGFPGLELGGMDGRMPAEIRAESEKQGVIWISTGEAGLWRIIFHKDKKEAAFERISDEGDKIYRQGMGKEAPQSKYKTLYVNGIIHGEYGFYRSLDEGATWQRINDWDQMFGDIRSIVGDPRTFGRFYIATGSRGVLWGQPK
jgi:xyloglucan-specific exo-beta-1,4-glucanase